MKGKWMLASITTICMEAPHMLINSMKNEKPLVLESNIPLICYESHICKQQGFLDYSQLLKIKLNDGLPFNDTNKAHGIYESYHTMDLCITMISHLDHHGC